jgi:hypothetical protein
MKGSLMSIIHFCSDKDDACGKVMRVIEIVVATDKYEVFHKLPEFENYLRSSLSNQDTLIFQANNIKILHKIASLKEFFSDHRIILILPDSKKETIALGHTLRPRFITYSDSDFLEMAAVLRNLLRQDTSGAQNPVQPTSTER